MNNMRLTPCDSAGVKNRSDDEYDDTTTDLQEYLWRDGGIQSEWDAANRMQQLREVALKLAQALLDEGCNVDPLDLSTIDVMVDTVKSVRLSK